MIIIDRIFIFVISEIRKIIVKISIRGLRFKIYHFNEYVIFIFYMKDVLPDDIYVFVQITREIYIVNDLKIDMLIEADIFILKKMIIDFVI